MINEAAFNQLTYICLSENSPEPLNETSKAVIGPEPCVTQIRITEVFQHWCRTIKLMLLWHKNLPGLDVTSHYPQ